MKFASTVHTPSMETVMWVAVAAFMWLTLALATGLLIGGAARMRDRIGGPIPVTRAIDARDRISAVRKSRLG
jgi:hypothetical protein